MKRYLFLFAILALVSRPVYAQSLADTTLSLSNIEIRGKLFSGLHGGEVKRFQVENNLSSVTSTISDAFRQMPSLITDIEGGVTFRGSNKAGMLINGIPYGLLEEYSGDVLIQLPALFFNRISLTSSPGIEFVPDGDAGLLNLSSAAFTSEDSPLTVTLGGGLQERYNAGAIVNLHPGKFHIVSKYNYRKEYRERSFRKTTTSNGATTVMNNNATARPNVHLVDLSVGYDLTPNDLLSVYGLYQLMEYSRYGGIKNGQLDAEGNVRPVMIRHRYNDQYQDAYAVETRWSHRFSHPYNQLEITFNYNNAGYDEDNLYKNEKPETGAIIREDNLFIRQDKNNYFWSVLFRKLVAGDWYVKAGYIGRQKNENYRTDANLKSGESWEPIPGKTYSYSFTRSTQLLYASAEKRWDRLTVEAGLQAESNWRSVSAYTADKKIMDDMLSPVKYNRFKLYPRVGLSLRTNTNGNLSLNYIQRVIRPTGSDLNPFVDDSDPTHLKQGNPDLKDESIHSLELSYSFSSSCCRISPSLYYRNKSNRIMEILDSQSVWKKENIGHSQTLGFELSGNWNPARVLNLGFSGDVYRDEIDGRTIGYNEKKSLVCWDIKGSASIRITPTTELQADGFYVSDQLTPQGKIKGHYSVNAGLSQYLMCQKLRVNLSLNNIFDSLAETTLIRTDKAQVEQVRNRDARVTWLTLTYSL